MDPNLENPAEHGMNPNLRKAVQQGIDQNSRDATPPGSIDALYALIRGNANALESIDAIPFVQTPLHEAASAGHTQLAMEIMTLKPSFARKLNQDGFTPMHLALQNDETRVALRLLDVDKDLVRIQGRGGLTPLHYAAQIGHLDLLVAFLSVCPESIEDVTIRRETVLHIALTNEKFDAFQLLLGWLRRAWFKDAFSLGRKLLNWQDEEGDTVLLIAISRNQPQIVRWLTKFPLDINIENRRGFTAFYILEILEADLENQMAMRRMLRCAAGRSRMDRGLRRPLAAYFSSPVRIDEKVYVYFLRQRSRITTEMRAALLVVVVLLITISFQTVLKPPEGILLDNTYQSIAPTNFSIEMEVKPLPHYTRTLFKLENSLTVLMFFTGSFFFAAISAILYLLPFGHFLLAGPICTLSLCFILSFYITFPRSSPISWWEDYFFVVSLCCAFLLLSFFISFVLREVRILVKAFVRRSELLDPNRT